MSTTSTLDVKFTIWSMPDLLNCQWIDKKENLLFVNSDHKYVSLEQNQSQFSLMCMRENVIYEKSYAAIEKVNWRLQLTLSTLKITMRTVTYYNGHILEKTVTGRSYFDVHCDLGQYHWSCSSVGWIRQIQILTMRYAAIREQDHIHSQFIKCNTSICFILQLNLFSF